MHLSVLHDVTIICTVNISIEAKWYTGVFFNDEVANNYLADILVTRRAQMDSTVVILHTFVQGELCMISNICD